ncbi:Poly(A) polymerase [Phytophthora megakarya]|uniref:polynucleotide adenylyltransferase n=1 Tax=Phytophthora megakarya TaxID=4795 RepID=A0A225WJR3_9STRA|nr:Poly(A) polymerase [Phytophthora megakarya]
MAQNASPSKHGWVRAEAFASRSKLDSSTSATGSSDSERQRLVVAPPLLNFPPLVRGKSPQVGNIPLETMLHHSKDGATKRVFSFKDAVVRPPPQSTSLPSPQPGNDKKQPATRHIRSRSITKIVESSNFKKRCEALKSHHSRKPENKGENGNTKATDVKKLTPLEELCERESFKQRQRATSCRTDKDEDTQHESPRHRAISNERVSLRRASLPCGTRSDSDTQDSLSSSSCDSSPVKAEVATLATSATVATVATDENEMATGCSTRHVRKVFDSDDDFLDCDDTNSESTVESSCPSPRPHFAAHRRSDLAEMEACQEQDELASMLSNCDEEDEEAYMLLDRITNLSAEFVANREYEESNALSWSVQHATQQGVITTQLQQNLFANICEGYLDEARDVLYHKCHLVPAVGSVVESPMQPIMDPSALQSFVDYVDEVSPTDAPEARMHKLQVLKQLSDLLTKWVKMVGRERELSEEHITLTKGSLFLAGSYRLGLDDPNSDIDAVCVAPWHVTHDDFFSSFCRLLEQTPGVSHLAPVPNAYVPLISLSFLGVRMDLLFARLPISSVEANQNIDSDHMLVGVHETSMKALNAPRVSSMLLCLVPKRREYRIVLRAVRSWARRRGIYSAKLGYLGGISWAILVAFVCQMYPNADPAKIFVRFFQVLSEWQWPQPVMLNMIFDAGLGFDMWDPRQSVFDRSHIMPIITPAYPHMNSSVQVSQPTFSVIYEELWRARYLAEIAVGISKPFPTVAPSPESSEVDLKAAVVCMATSMPSFDQPLNAVEPTGDEVIVESGAWDKLFQPSNFFIRYSSYMVFNFQADSESAMHKWGKFVQSRLRKLVDNLYHMSPVSRVHAFPRYFAHTCDAQRHGPGSCMFIGIEFHYRRHQTIQPKDDPEVKKTLEQTIRFFLATDLQQMEDKQPDMTADAKVLNWEELPDFVFGLGRTNADLERAKYTDDLEKMGFSQNNTPSFRPPYYVNSYNRNGKWRSGGPRKYAGGQRKQRRDFRSAPRSYPGTQAG